MKSIIILLFLITIGILSAGCDERTNRRPEDSPYSTHGESQRVRDQNNITSDPNRPRRW